ncbi:MAG: hypothetical protein V1799_07975 [bacterium]
MAQMLLVMGAFAMLSTLALSINGMMTGSMQLGIEMEATMNAVSIGQSLIDEIMAKDFDEHSTHNDQMYATSEATPAGSFGIDGAGESCSGAGGVGYDTTYASLTKFDDVDDYHHYIRWVRDSRLGWFVDSVTVEYVDETTPTTASGSQTFFKTITVSVTNDNMPKQLNNLARVQPYYVRDISIYRRYF